MARLIVLVLLLLPTSNPAAAAVPNTSAAAAAVAATTCDVKDRGAAADNSTEDTAVFAAAILDPQCHVIIVPPGAYLLRPLPSLSSNTELRLLPGAVLQGWRDVRSYPNATSAYYSRWGQNISDCFTFEGVRMCRAAPLLRADGAANLSLVGGGTIDGSGPQLWYNTSKLCPAVFSYNFWHLCRPLLVAFNSVQNLHVDNVTLLNGPYIHFGLDAVDAVVSRLTVSTAAWQCRGYAGAPNTDCVDISGRNIHVSNSSCHNGDE